MKKRIFLALCLVIVAASLNVAKAEYTNYTKTIPSYADLTGNKVYNENVKIGEYVEFLNGNVKVNGDLYVADNVDFSGDLEVTGNLIVADYVDFDGNVTVGGNATFGEYTEIKKTLSAKNVTIGDYADITTINITNFADIKMYADIQNMFVGGDLQVGEYFELFGKAKVLGNVYMADYADIKDTLYAYKSVTLKDYPDVLGQKFKVLGNLIAGEYYENSSRTYVYGGTTLGEYSDEKYSNFSGLFGKIDPLLKFNLTNTAILQLKQKVDNAVYNAERQTSQQKKKQVYAQLFDSLAPYIETESFDQTRFQALKKMYTGNATVSQTPYPTTSSVNNTQYKAYLPRSLEQKLARIISNLPSSQKNYILEVVLQKIDEVTSRLKNQTQTQNTVQQINILLGIRAYVQKELDSNSGGILEQLGL
ncbi:polymer-forming cytoskeletal protein [Candidatus Gracilibacteria bacterium]|nr:polymer-forming cytoskeletal protein [Candidatus Gracilibacteria bacterium]